MPRIKNPANLKTSHLLRTASGITAIGRHSIKGKTPSGLLPDGEAKARWSGSRLPKGFMVFARAGDQTRHASTARIMVESYSGKKVAEIKPAAELGFSCIKDMAAMEKRIGEIGDPAVLVEWIDGKISPAVIEPAEKVGIAVLKGAIGATRGTMATRPFYLNLTSSWFESAVLKALGIDYRGIKPKLKRRPNNPKQGDSLKETEALLFYHMPDGKTILAFRGRKFDVTTNLAKIIGK